MQSEKIYNYISQCPVDCKRFTDKKEAEAVPPSRNKFILWF